MSELNGYGTPITKLTALDDIFAATGMASVKVTRWSQEERRNVERLLELPIQSVDTEEATTLAGRPPKPPKTSQGPGKAYVDDVNDPQYIMQQGEHTRKFLTAMVCLGLAVDIEDSTGTVVWSADNKVQNLEAARGVLKKMGLVDGQLMALVRAIRELTTEAEEQAASD